MKEFKLRETDEFIKLGQLLKACDLVSSGVEAKIVILDGNVYVNGEVCLMRGKKIHPGDIVKLNENEIKVI
ncbi:ribosome-associated protein [Lachnospiraceae bacterium KH1T2]|nr:ribosome-associated protein [Lachnospiraceae bacterium KH1T2]